MHGTAFCSRAGRATRAGGTQKTAPRRRARYVTQNKYYTFNRTGWAAALHTILGQERARRAAEQEAMPHAWKIKTPARVGGGAPSFCLALCITTLLSQLSWNPSVSTDKKNQNEEAQDKEAERTTSNRQTNRHPRDLPSVVLATSEKLSLSNTTVHPGNPPPPPRPPPLLSTWDMMCRTKGRHQLQLHKRSESTGRSTALLLLYSRFQATHLSHNHRAKPRRLKTQRQEHNDKDEDKGVTTFQRCKYVHPSVRQSTP